MSVSFISFENTLLMLGLNLEEVADDEAQFIQFLIDQTTAVVIAQCNRDPRIADPDYPDDPVEDCSSLGWVAGRLLQTWYPSAVNQTTGIESQDFNEVKIKYAADTGLDPFSKMLLNRFRKISIL